MSLKVAVLIFTCLLVAQVPLKHETEVEGSNIWMNGSGTSADPYVITDVNDLQDMKDNLGSYYILANDINASSTGSWNGGLGFVPIGSSSSPFTGNLDGKGYNITGLFIDREIYVGLFGYTSSASIKNLNLNGDITGTLNVGMICGFQDEGLIKKGTVSGRVEGERWVGGLVGWCEGRVDQCNSTVYVRGILNGNEGFGGVIGCLSDGTISDCLFNGTLFLTGSSSIDSSAIVNVGGFCGKLDTGTLSGSGANISLKTDSGNILRHGGFVGYNYGGTISDCWVTGTVEAKSHNGAGSNGGFVGQNDGTIKNSFSSGSVVATGVSRTAFTGGFAGYNKGSINKCYSDTYTYARSDNVEDIGGFCAHNYGGDVNNSFAHGNVRAIPARIVSSVGAVGGFMGYLRNGEVSYSYSTGDVNVPTYQKSNNGGFLGRTDSGTTILSCFWDTQSSGRTDGFGSTTHTEIVGKTTVEMKNSATYISDGWNFTSTWAIKEGVDYPIQRAFLHQAEITAQYEKVSLEDVLFSGYFNLSVNSIQGPLISTLLTTDADWLIIDSLDNSFYGTPRNRDIGNFTIELTVLDQYYIRTGKLLEFDILNVNDPPVIQTDPTVSTQEDIQYTLDLNATDIDPTNDTFTWSMISNASWLSLESDTGILNGTPSNYDVGIYNVNITVDDGNGGNDTLIFDITVNNVNDPPTIITTDIMTTLEDELFQVKYNATDIDLCVDILGWSLETDASWLDIVNSTIYGIPDNDDVGLYFVNLTVEDGMGGSDNSYFQLEVVNVNDPPSITGSAVAYVYEDTNYSCQMSVLDVDLRDSHFWYIVEGPEWLTIDWRSGSLGGIPTGEDVGIWNISIMLKDSNFDLDIFNYTLEVINVNDPPEVIASGKTVEMKEDGETSVNLSEYFTDEDSKVLDFFYDSEIFDVTIVGNIAFIRPTANWSGSSSVTFTVTDGEFDLSVVQSILVHNVFDAPVIVSIDFPLTSIVGEELIFSIVADDADFPYGDKVTFSWSSNVSGALGAGEEIFVDLSVGLHEITVLVEDSHSLVTEGTFQLEILPVEEIVERSESSESSSGKGSGAVIAVVAVVIVLIVIGAAVGAFIFTRKKKDEKEE